MTSALTISKLTFAAGSTLGGIGLELPPSTVTVLVGPNNSGKSLALREIENWCNGGSESGKVIADIEIIFPNDGDDAMRLLNVFQAQPPQGQLTERDHIWIGCHTFKQSEPMRHSQLHLTGVLNAVNSKNKDQLRQKNGLIGLYTARLDGRTRFALSDPKPTGDLMSHPQNHLWALFKDDPARERVRQLTAEAFGLHFVIDPTAMANFRIRMSPRAPVNNTEEQALDDAARTFHKNAPLVSDLSDGVQAFVGLVSAIMSLPHKILLVDEPEAFLHPPLARRLGRNLATLATERNASLVVATHSAEFVMGCIESGPDTTIVRLTFEDGVATARTLPATNLTDLMRDPLLRSTGALRGLFHRAVVVTEAEADRAFYDEINHRLQDAGRGVDDSLFLNTQNWQTTSRVAGLLRRLGIPAAVVIDLDTICEETGWKAIYGLLNLDANLHSALETQRAACEKYFKAMPEWKSSCKQFGVNALDENQRAELEALIDDLAKLGVFVVTVGEIERWLPTLGISGRKTDWLMNAFTLLGNDPNEAAYVRPTSGDVWQFLDKIAAWCRNPNRQGVA